MTEDRDPAAPPGTIGHEAAGLGHLVGKQLSSSNDPLVGGRIGEYEIRRVLGRGGMGSVYEAFHVHLHKVVAIKVLAAHLLDDPRAVERFRREMRAIGRLNSPYVVQAYDANLTGDLQYIAMEFVDGVDADELVRRLHAIPIEDSCEIIRQASLGLEDAHREHLVHRDVKPKNLAISKYGQVKILDLGLALCKSEVMATGRLTAQAAIGSYQYMAPEQFDDSHEVDIRADIYSLGCTLYHLLTGNPPFSGPQYRTLTSLMDAHRSTPPPPVQQFNARVPKELAEIVDRTLAKHPDDRFENPGEVAAAVSAFAQGTNLRKLMSVAEKTTEVAQTLDVTADPSPTTDPFAMPVPRWQPSRTSLARGRRLVRKRWMVVIAVVAVIAAGLIGLREWHARTLRTMRAEVAELTLLMPGLNGNWWMDETPWLLPPVRATVAEALVPGSSGTPVLLKRQPTIGASPLSEVIEARKGIDVASLQQSLKEASGPIVTSSATRPVEEAFLVFREDDPESIDDSKLAEKLNKIALGFRSEVEPTALEWHLLAVRAHKQGSWEEAKQAYEKALAAFDEINPEPILAALCHSDYGELLYARGAYEDAAIRFRAASARVSENPKAYREFLVYTKCREADSLRKVPESMGAARDLLERVTERVSLLPDDHPLSAFHSERQAWLALDDWRMEESVGFFEESIRQRQRSADGGNRRAEFFIFFNQQGLAMAERLRGRNEESQDHLESLTEALSSALADEKRYSAKQRSQLRSRYLNALERRADSPLFGPGEIADAREILKRALEFSKRSLEWNGPLARHIDRVRCKWLISRIAAGEDVRGELAAISDQPWDTRLETSYRQLARSASAVSTEATERGGGSIADLVLSHTPEQSSRDEMEFCFLAGRLLFALAPAKDPSVDAVIVRIAMLASSIGRRSEDEDVLRYLRPQYDGMIRRGMSSPTLPVEDLAHIVVESRSPSLTRLPADFLAFYFGSDWGVVIDSRAGEAMRKTPLNFGFESLRAAREDKALRLDLSHRVPAEIHERRIALDGEAVFWNDPIRGIVESDFPRAGGSSLKGGIDEAPEQDAGAP